MPESRCEDTWPRLSQTLTGPVAPDRCQSCGCAESPAFLAGVDVRPLLTRHQEHDWRDRPESIIVVLCEPCEKRLVEKHPRLYRALQPHEPFAGAMPLCLDCKHRQGTKCLKAKANGGPGVEVIHPKPVSVHVCRSPRRLSGWQTVYMGPAKACDGREPA